MTGVDQLQGWGHTPVSVDHDTAGVQIPESKGATNNASTLTAFLKQDASIEELEQLNVGAPVVHLEHGVGRYEGLERIDSGAVENEFLVLSYADGEKLFVPVSSLHLLSRYSYASDQLPPLHRLGSSRWEKQKRRAVQKACRTAEALHKAFRRRMKRDGIAYRPNIVSYQMFCDAFPHDLTVDQDKVTRQVLADLWSPKPMDRIVCGDVGFGKTEIALRAAFIAAESGRQVAVLAPTTLLAQQHYASFVERFDSLPFHIELLSRSADGQTQRSVREAVSDGQVDIIIGTHRLLSKKTRYADLGLVIIDEEHRFGVRHKRRLRRLREKIGSLSLSATPIPRTLGLAIAGLRDLSIIATAPPERKPVRTEVAHWDDDLVRDACLSEMKRGGQIYVLHDRVRTIKRFTDRLRDLMPDARVAYAHGQMSEAALYDVMRAFTHQQIDILVTTTIIESGIDNPQANTIIVDRADKLGVAQLHQLRGRVGRSSVQAVAWLMTPSGKPLGDDASRRLEALEALPSLGAGSGLAAHDLEIRGAGELLGEGQSGHIDAIGFALYNEILGRALALFRRGLVPDEHALFQRETEIDLGTPALLPEQYVNDVSARLKLYRQLARCHTEANISALSMACHRQYGTMPLPAETLFREAQLRILCSAIGVQSVRVADEAAVLGVDSIPDVVFERVQQKVKQQPQMYTLSDDHQSLSVRLDTDERCRFNTVSGLLVELGNLLTA